MSGTLARRDLTPGLKTRADLQLLEESEDGVRGRRAQSSIPTDSSYQSAFMEQPSQALGLQCSVHQSLLLSQCMSSAYSLSCMSQDSEILQRKVCICLDYWTGYLAYKPLVNVCWLIEWPYIFQQLCEVSLFPCSCACQRDDERGEVPDSAGAMWGIFQIGSSGGSEGGNST